MSVHASYRTETQRKRARQRPGANIRVGNDGAHAGESVHSFYLTVEEAERLLFELDAALRLARAVRPNFGPGGPPTAGSAAAA